MIFSNFFYREVGQNFFAVFSVLILIAFSILFVQYLGEAAAGKLRAALVYQLLVLNLVNVVSMILPICLYLAIILVLGRMQKDNELVAMHCAGVGVGFMLMRAFKLGLLSAVILGVITLGISPWAAGKIAKLEQRADQESDITGISAGRFKEFNKGNRILYVERMSADRSAMENVFMQMRENDRIGVLTSDSARFEVNPKTGTRYVVFHDGRRYAGTAGALDYTITEYKKYAVRLDTDDSTVGKSRYSALPTLELLKNGDDHSIAELQWRVSAPLSVVLLALLAVTLCQKPYDNARYLRILIATLVYFLYTNLLGISKSLVKKGDISPLFGLWWVHGIVLLAIIIMFYYPRLMQRYGRRFPLRHAFAQLTSGK